MSLKTNMCTRHVFIGHTWLSVTFISHTVHPCYSLAGYSKQFRSVWKCPFIVHLTDRPSHTGFKASKVLLKHTKRETGGVSYPLVRRMMSPGWIRLPSSSHTEMAMLPLLSATLHERTSCPSFVFVTRPARAHQSSVKSQPLQNYRKHTDDCDTGWVMCEKSKLQEHGKIDVERDVRQCYSWMLAVRN